MTRIVAAAALVIGLGTSGQAASEYPIEHPKHVKWSFAGVFGTYDTFQLQRGFQVYREVCAACHALSYVRFRNLAEEGGPHFTFDQVRALSAEYEVDGGVDEGRNGR
ncbi:MAG: cytochrome c1 [Chloroflexota bacterium]